MLGDVCDGAHDVVGEGIEVVRRPLEGPAPAVAVRAEARGSLVDRSPQKTGLARVERVGAVDLGPKPAQAVPLQAQAAEIRRSDTHRVERRAVVVEHARHGQLAGSCAPADVTRRLEDGDVDAVLGQSNRRGEPVRARPDDDRGAHLTASAISGSFIGPAPATVEAVQVTSKGMGPSGSQGSCATASAT